MYTLLLVLIYIAFISLGLPDSCLVRVAGHTPESAGAGFLYGNHHHGHIGRNRGVQSVF